MLINGGSIEFFCRGSDFEVALKDSNSCNTLEHETGPVRSFKRIRWDTSKHTGKSAFIDVSDMSGDLELRGFMILPVDPYNSDILFVTLHQDRLEIVEERRLGELYEKDNRRPRFHFTPSSGWLNDPNGLAHWNGLYHLFYQYNPFEPVWGPMHWGHAVSRDLIRWKHLPIFLFPDNGKHGGDETGSFSGSAYPDDDRLVVMYTKNWDPRFHPEKTPQSQHVVLTYDGIDHKAVSGSAVVEPGKDSLPYDFRDPKIYKEENGLWAAVVGGSLHNRGRILLYRSEDLANWYLASVLYTCDEYWARMVECPELLKLDGKYLVLISLIHYIGEVPTYHAFHMIGKIINDVFHPEIIDKTDFGDDFYAAQTFIDDSGRRILIAWTKAYPEHNTTVDRNWAGIHTLPRALSLNRDGRLRMKPVDEVESLRVSSEPQLTLSQHDVSRHGKTVELPSNSFELKLRFTADIESGGFELRIGSEKDEDEFVSVGFSDDKRFFIKVSMNNQIDSSYHETLPVNIQGEALDLHIFFDRSIIEVFADNYVISGTRKFRPSDLSKKLTIKSDPGIYVDYLVLWQMSSAW